MVEKGKQRKRRVRILGSECSGKDKSIEERARLGINQARKTGGELGHKKGRKRKEMMRNIRKG